MKSHLLKRETEPWSSMSQEVTDTLRGLKEEERGGLSQAGDPCPVGRPEGGGWSKAQVRLGSGGPAGRGLKELGV